MDPLARYDIGNQLSTRILAAARLVFDLLGPGCAQERYRQAVAGELRNQKLDVQALFPVDVWQNDELAALYYLDLFVEWQVVVEVRSSHRPLREPERSLLLEYLSAARAPMGILLNFGLSRLECERVFPRGFPEL